MSKEIKVIKLDNLNAFKNKIDNEIEEKVSSVSAADIGALTNIEIGSVTTGAAGSEASASVVTSGTVAALNLTIPKGDKGDTGAQGVQGVKGNTGAAAGFGTPTATIDNNTGTPSVTVTSSGANTAKVFNFAFKNLKGAKGDTGATGTAAGFGTPTATVDANVGTPSVTVTASGANTAKVFNFAFKNLKGAKGDKGDPGTNATTTAVATQSANGLMSAADKKKLDGVAAGATANTAATAAPKAAGTAAVGTSAKYAKEDHVHPAQTSVTGNAGTATKLATARTINGVAFDGTKNIELPLSSSVCKVTANFPANKTSATQTSLTIPSGYKYYYLIFEFGVYVWTFFRRHLITASYKADQGITGLSIAHVNNFADHGLSTSNSNNFVLKAYDEDDRSIFTGATSLDITNKDGKLLFAAGHMSTASGAVCNNTPILVGNSGPSGGSNINYLCKVTAVFFN